jgi:hypothetical protein
MVTFRLTVPQFQELLGVILAAEAPDHLTNLVLMACSRPHDGIISVPVPPDDARALCALVESAAASEPSRRPLAESLRHQAA